MKWLNIEYLITIFILIDYESYELNWAIRQILVDLSWWVLSFSFTIVIKCYGKADNLIIHKWLQIFI